MSTLKVTRVDPGFRWDGERQHHVPSLLVEFEPVPANGPCDAKGWRDRDALAATLTAATPPVPAGSPSVRVGVDTNPRPEFLALAQSCGAVLTGKPDGSESVTVVFSIPAWGAFDLALVPKLTDADIRPYVQSICRHHGILNGVLEADLSVKLAELSVPTPPTVPPDLDVRKILLAIVPGDGDGYEVYAQSVADVEDKLAEMDQRIEALETALIAAADAWGQPEFPSAAVQAALTAKGST